MNCFDEYCGVCKYKSDINNKGLIGKKKWTPKDRNLQAKLWIYTTSEFMVNTCKLTSILVFHERCYIWQKSWPCLAWPEESEDEDGAVSAALHGCPGCQQALGTAVTGAHGSSSVVLGRLPTPATLSAWQTETRGCLKHINIGFPDGTAQRLTLCTCTEFLNMPS